MYRFAFLIFFIAAIAAGPSAMAEDMIEDAGIQDAYIQAASTSPTPSAGELAEATAQVAQALGTAAVEAMAPVIGAEPVNIPGDPSAGINPDDIAKLIQTPAGVGFIMATATPVIIEFVKMIPNVAPWLLRILSVIIGGLGGLFIGLGWFGAVSYGLGISILSGILGGGGFTLIKWGSQHVRGTSRSGGFSTIGSMIAMAISGVLLIVMIGCTAAQKQVWANAGTSLGQCLAGCGLMAADDLVTSWEGNEGIDAAAIGWDALPCVIGCAGKAGAILWTQMPQAMTNRDSVGATMSTMTKALTVPDDFDAVKAACGDPADGPPRCMILLRHPPKNGMGWIDAR